MNYKKKDFWLSLVSGLITGVIAWQLFEFLEIVRYQDISFAWLALVVPLLWIAGVRLGYFLSQWFDFFRQFGKYVAIGFLNFVIDLGVLNFLIHLSGVALGFRFSIFKGIAFIVAVVNSYFWNKFWAFEAGGSSGGKKEALKFLGVNLIALAVNVGVASLVANGIDPLFGLSDQKWANIGAVAGSAAALIFSFIGLRRIVFKKELRIKNGSLSQIQT